MVRNGVRDTPPLGRDGPAFQRLLGLAYHRRMGEGLVVGVAGDEVRTDRMVLRKYLPVVTRDDPPNLTGATAALHEASGLVVIVGEEGCYTWDGGQFAELRGGAPAFPFAAMTYDTITQDVILFGGEGNDDTWKFDGTSWSSFPNGGFDPEPNTHAAMLFMESQATTYLLTSGEDSPIEFWSLATGAWGWIRRDEGGPMGSLFFDDRPVLWEHDGNIWTLSKIQGKWTTHWWDSFHKSWVPEQMQGSMALRNHRRYIAWDDTAGRLLLGSHEVSGLGTMFAWDGLRWNNLDLADTLIGFPIERSNFVYSQSDGALVQFSTGPADEPIALRKVDYEDGERPEVRFVVDSAYSGAGLPWGLVIRARARGTGEVLGFPTTGTHLQLFALWGANGVGWETVASNAADLTSTEDLLEFSLGTSQEVERFMLDGKVYLRLLPRGLESATRTASLRVVQLAVSLLY